MAATKDMTNGKPMQLIINFVLPLLFGMLFQQTYNLIDTIIVGKILGVKALAAVGATGSINFLILGFCLGVCNGFAIPVAQQFGAKDYAALKKFVGNANILAIIISVVITAITVFFCHDILVLMNTPEDIIEDSYRYIVVLFAGIPAIMFYNLLSGYLRSLGDSIFPVVFLIIASIINIVLDVIFIMAMGFGVDGAAYATVISEVISGLLCLFYIKQNVPLLHFNRSDLKLQSKYSGKLLYLGVSMGFQFSITAVGSIVLQTAVNGLGSIAVASMTASSRISMFGVCPLDALGSAMATFGGQNVGANKVDRCKEGLKSAMLLGIVYDALFFLLVFVFGKELICLFVNRSETVVIEQGYIFLVINVAFYFFLLIVDTFRFMIQGMGFSGFAIFAGVFEMIARALVGLVFIPIFGFIAACFASPLAWIFADAFLIPAFFYCHRKLSRQPAN